MADEDKPPPSNEEKRESLAARAARNLATLEAARRLLAERGATGEPPKTKQQAEAEQKHGASGASVSPKPFMQPRRIIVPPQEPSILVTQNKLKEVTGIASGVAASAFTLFVGIAFGALPAGLPALKAILGGLPATSQEAALQALMLGVFGSLSIVTGIVAAATLISFFSRRSELWRTGEHFDYYESEDRLVRVDGPSPPPRGPMATRLSEVWKSIWASKKPNGASTLS